MASCSTQNFGFELMIKVADNQLTKKEDVIVLFTHWYLIKVGYRCIGLGDKVPFYLSLFPFKSTKT